MCPAFTCFCRFAELVCVSRIIALSVHWGGGGVSVAGFGAFLRILAQSQLMSLELPWLASNDSLHDSDEPLSIHPNVCLSLRDFVQTLGTLRELGVGHLAPEVSDHPLASEVTPEWLQLKIVAAHRGVRIAMIAPGTHWRQSWW